MLRFLRWGSSSKSKANDNNLDDELNQQLPYPIAHTHSNKSYKTPPSQISISAPIPRAPGTSLTGYDNPYLGTPGAGSSTDPYPSREHVSGFTRVGGYNTASGSFTNVGSSNITRVPIRYAQYHLPSASHSDSGGSHGAASSSIINDGPLPAVIRIDTEDLPSREAQPASRGGIVHVPSSHKGHSHSEQGATRLSAGPTASFPVRKTLSSPATPTSPPHHYSISPADSTSSSSELTPTFGAANPSSSSSNNNNNNYNGWKGNLKLHLTNHIYSQSTQSLPANSSSSTVPPLHAHAIAGSQLRSAGMHSDPSLTAAGATTGTTAARPDAGKHDAFYGHLYSYPLVKPLSPIAEQDYMSPDSMQRTHSLPPSGSEKELARMSYGSSPMGSLSSEITRPSPICASPFISRPLNRTASQGSSRTHVSATSSSAAPNAGAAAAGGGSSIRQLETGNPPLIPPLDLRPSFIGPHQGASNPSPTGSGSRVRTSRYSNPMPMIIGSMEGGDLEDELEYGGLSDRESLHAESFVTATSDADELAAPRPTRRMNSARDIEAVDDESFRRNSMACATEGGHNVSGGAAGGVRQFAPREGVLMPANPSASESFITRRWDRDAGLGAGVPTFRAKKQWINVTPAFWTFWVGFLCPFLWLVGGWHFTHFGEQPPRLTFWEFYLGSGVFCGGRRRLRNQGSSEVDVTKREGKRKAVEPPPPLPRWVSEKQSSELGRARLNDPKRSLKGISFGYPFIPRPVLVYREESVLRTMVNRLLVIMDKPNRVFDQLYGIRLREVRGRPEGPRRMFDPWIQRCRYALCYGMLFLAIGLCTASTYLIVYNTRQL